MVKQTDMLSEKYVQSSTDGIEASLAEFFASAIPNASDVAITSIDVPPADSGFSAENFFVDLEWVEKGENRGARYVVRRQAGREMFPGKDFSQERRIQEVLSTKTDSPVPKIVGFDDGAEQLGAPFYVMEYLKGSTPPAASPHETGMLVELSEDARRKLWFSGLAELGRLHRLDPMDIGLDFVSSPAADGSQLTSTLDYWEEHYLTGSEPNPLPLMIEVMSWLRENHPDEEPLKLIWGDSRIGNMLFDDDQNCVGIVDWELASLGDPLQDLAYWTYSEDHYIHIAANGALPGWPTMDETIAAYESVRGETVDRMRLEYYRLVAGYWIICTLNQLVNIKKDVGQFPPELEVTEEAFTPVSFLRSEFESTKVN